MITAQDLRELGYTVDDATDPDTWTVSGFNRTWVFPTTDDVTAQKVYQLALDANNIQLRTQAENAVDQLEQAIQNWDSLTAAQAKAATKTCIQVVTHLTRLTMRRYDEAL